MTIPPSPIAFELFSDWACAPVTERLGAIHVPAGEYGVVIDGSDSCDLTVVPDTRTVIDLRSVIRITDARSVVREYRVQSVSRDRLNSALITVRGLAPLADLGTAGLVRRLVSGVVRYGVSDRLPLDEWITQHVLTNLADDELSWLGLGSVATNPLVSLTVPDTGWTRLQLLRELVSAAGTELRLRRDGEQGYLIDVGPIGASAAVVPATWGHNLFGLQTIGNDGDLATAITILRRSEGEVSNGIAENAWRIVSVAGSAPWWVELADPAGREPPIAFDNQCVGNWLLLSDASTVEILESRAIDSSVRVASSAGLVVGEHVQTVLDAAATRLTELSTPVDVPGRRLHRVEVVDTEPGQSGRNLLRNALFLDWTDTWTPLLWTLEGGLVAVAEYPRDSVTTSPPGLVLNGTITSGGTGIPIRGAPAGFGAYVWESFDVAGDPGSGRPGFTGYVANSAVFADGLGQLGVVTINAAPSGGYTWPDGTPVTFNPARPAALPVERDVNNLLRFCASTIDSSSPYPSPSGRRLQSEPVTVKYVSALPYLVARAAFSTNSDCAIRLSTGEGMSSTSGGARHEVLSVSRHLTGDATVSLSLYGNRSVGATNIYTLARWVTLGLSATPESDQLPYPGSWDNLLWQRGNRNLVARALSVQQISVTLADLATLAGYSLSRDQFVLGGAVELAEGRVPARITAITLDAVDPTSVRVTLDARPASLVRLLAERL